MANPSVDKLKALGLQHGEKAVVALAAGVCLFCLYSAMTRETIDITPEAIKSSAAAATTNINKKVDPVQLAQTLEEEFLKVPNLVEKVEAVGKDKFTQDLLAYVPKPWVTAPPDAGVQRNSISIAAPYDLVATASRGGVLMYALDEEGNIIYEEEDSKLADANAAPAAPKKKKRRGAQPNSGMSMPDMMAMNGPAAKEEDPKEVARRLAKKRAGVVGDAPAEDAKDDATADTRKPKEVVRGLRWVAITGLFDHRKLRESYAKALNLDFANAQPNYQRLDLQRQELGDDGVTWSDWAEVDRDENLEVLNNIPEKEEEMTIEEVRLAALVDELPFLKTGIYRGVHLAAFLSASSKEALKPKTPPPASAANGMMGGASMQMYMQRGNQGPTGSSMSMMDSSMYRMQGQGSMQQGPAEDTNFPKSEAPKLMVRSLDFTVEPETTYRYRARVVVKNPNFGREDIAPGVDNAAKELKGSWSESTELVTVPPDIATYAVNKSLTGGDGRGDQVKFQVATWNPKDGQTIVKAFDVGVGQVIGDVSPAKVPDPEGKGVKQPKIDFTSRQVVLDTEGGNRSLEHLGLTGTGFDVPALAVVLRPDGTVAVRSESRDKRDPSMSEMLTDYTTVVKEAEEGVVKPKKKRRAPTSSMPGMTSSRPRR